MYTYFYRSKSTLTWVLEAFRARFPVRLSLKNESTPDSLKSVFNVFRRKLSLGTPFDYPSIEFSFRTAWLEITALQKGIGTSRAWKLRWTADFFVGNNYTWDCIRLQIKHCHYHRHYNASNRRRPATQAISFTVARVLGMGYLRQPDVLCVNTILVIIHTL